MGRQTVLKRASTMVVVYGRHAKCSYSALIVNFVGLAYNNVKKCYQSTFELEHRGIVAHHSASAADFFKLASLPHEAAVLFYERSCMQPTCTT